MHREIAGFALCIAVSFAAGWIVNGWRKDAQIAEIQATHDRNRAVAEAQARAKEQKWSDESAALRKAKDVEIATVNRKHSITVAGLRKRSERPDSSKLSETPRACDGASGAELAKRDAEFLAGYAADAARLEAALDYCEAEYNKLRK